MIPNIGNINVTAGIDRQTSRLLKLPLTCSGFPDNRKKCSVRRELLEPVIIAVSDKDISGTIDGETTRKVELAILCTFSAIKSTYTEQGDAFHLCPGRSNKVRIFRNLIDDQFPVVFSSIKSFPEVRYIDLLLVIVFKDAPNPV